MMWNDVSFSIPHVQQVGLFLSPITYKCLLRLLCPVRRQITTLDCVPLKDNNVASLGPEINSRACLCVLQGPHHNTKFWLSVQLFIFLTMFCLKRAQSREPVQFYSFFNLSPRWRWGYAMAQLVEALRYKPEGRGFEFSLT